MPGAGRVRKAIGAVGEELERGQELRRGQKERVVESALEKQKFLGEAAEYEKEKARAEAEVYTSTRETYEQMVAENQEREMQRQEYVRGEINKINDVIGEIRSAKIDPTRFYKHPDGSMDYPKSIAAAIAVGLGALGSTLPARYGGGVGGPNRALEIIDKAIDRDIQAQRDDIVNQRAGIGLQMNALSKMQELFDSERKREAGAKIAMLDLAKLKLDEIAQKNPDQRVQLKYQELGMALDDKIREQYSIIDMESHKEALSTREKMVGFEMGATQLQQQVARYKASAAKIQLKGTGGKLMQAGERKRVAEVLNGLKSVEEMQKDWDKQVEQRWSTVTASAAAHISPFASESKRFNNKSGMNARFTAKQIEGGKLTDQDVADTKKYGTPLADDAEETGNQKIDYLRKRGVNRLKSELQAMEAGGIDIRPILAKPEVQRALGYGGEAVSLPGEGAPQ
jgi:hypothetical protein